MMEVFYRDILEFYMDPANVKALEEYRKSREVDKKEEEDKT